MAGCSSGSEAIDQAFDEVTADVPVDAPSDVQSEIPADLQEDTETVIGLDVEPEVDTPKDKCLGNTDFEVGAGVYDVTGPVAGMGMMGYVVMDQYSAGIHMRLRARAFVVASPCNGNRVALVVADIQGMFGAVHDEVIRRLEAKYPGVYNADNVMLSATHTHSGPGGLSYYNLYQFAPVGGFNQENWETVVDGIVQAIGRAHESLRPGHVRIASADLMDTGRNRSPDSFAQNPAVDRTPFPNLIDTTDTLLRLEETDGTPVAAIDFFGVHVTTVGAINKLITPDNKGYAAYLFEKAQGADYGATTTFVAGFFNTTAGDSSPNVNGFSFEEKDGERDFQDMKVSANKEYASARSLFDGTTAPLTGGVAAVKRFVNMSAFTVRPEYADGLQHTTCPAATGLSMLAGGRLDWPGSGEPNQTCETTGGDLCTDCQAEKPIMVPIGDSNPPLGPDILPFQIIRIGNLAMATAPFEVTTVSGLRLRRTIGATLQPAGVDRVLVAGYSNYYCGYLATREEYAVQDYEGASTVFGPWQLAATTQILDGLAVAVRDGQVADPGIAPREMADKVVPMGPISAFDSVPSGIAFGDVAQEVPVTVARGTVATAVFWAAHPANDFRIQDTYLAVEIKTGDSWTRVADDGAFETKMKWAVIECPDGHCSQASILWDVPADATPGTYRLKHFGSSKSVGGTLTPYQGVSGEFEVL
jgi:neutral ceramidase